MVLALLDVESFPRFGELVRADHRVLGVAAREVIAALEAEARAGAVSYTPGAVVQLGAFLERCSPTVLDAVFPSDSDTIDPQTVVLIRGDLDAAEAADAEYQRHGGLGSLDAAARSWRKVLAAPALDSAFPALKAALLNDAAGCAIRRFWHAGDPADLAGARERYEQALALTPRTSVRRIGRLGNLAMVRREAHLRHGNADALDDAESLLREAVAVIDRLAGAPPVTADALTNLALVLRERHLQTGDPAPLLYDALHLPRPVSPEQEVAISGPRVTLALAGQLTGPVAYRFPPPAAAQRPK